MRSAAHVHAIIERNNAAFKRARLLADPATGKGHRSPVWRLVSELIGHRVFCDLEPWNAVAIVDELLADHGGWDLLPRVDVWGNEVSPRDEFVRAWMEIEKPLAPVFEPAEAWAFAERWPLTCDHWPAEEDGGYRTAVSLLFWYAVLLDADGRFFLSCRKFGDTLATSHQTAHTYLRRAQGERLLDLLQAGSMGRAARYRFDLAAVTFAGGN